MKLTMTMALPYLGETLRALKFYVRVRNFEPLKFWCKCSCDLNCTQRLVRPGALWVSSRKTQVTLCICHKPFFIKLLGSFHFSVPISLEIWFLQFCPGISGVPEALSEIP